MTVDKPQERPLAVRVSAELRAYLQEQAKRNFRSVSSEVAARVERTRQADLLEQPSPTGTGAVAK